MPTYEYACTACGHEFETFQSIKADSLVDCPACRKPRLKRKIGLGAGIIFKGSGFYETDYRRSGKTSDSAKGDSEKASPAKTTESAPSKKPATASA